MPADHVDLVSHWRIHSDVDRVWAALTEARAWPVWWPSAMAVHTVREGAADGVGAVRRIDWATRLPSRLNIEVEVIESVKGERLRARSRGPLEGEGLWLLRAEASHTDVTCVWRVRLVNRWMRWLAPLLAPLFRWNHSGVMRAGEAGLRRHLESRVPDSSR